MYVVLHINTLIKLFVNLDAMVQLWPRSGVS